MRRNGNDLRPEDIIPMPCKQPKFPRDQRNQTAPGKFHLDKDNHVSLTLDILGDASLRSYIEEACKVERFTGDTAYGPKPRREVCYTTDGKAYRYSTVDHKTTKYPPHVLAVVERLAAAAKLDFPESKYTQLSNGIDIAYSDEFKRGGSVSEHADKEGDWGLVLVFSLGQSRWFRIRNVETGQRYNFLIPHNSLLAMHGETFQAKYLHSVDKLNEQERVGVRLSLNVRFEPATK